jgi:hypothetical protein
MYQYLSSLNHEKKQNIENPNFKYIVHIVSRPHFYQLGRSKLKRLFISYFTSQILYENHWRRAFETNTRCSPFPTQLCYAKKRVWSGSRNWRACVYSTKCSSTSVWISRARTRSEGILFQVLHRTKFGTFRESESVIERTVRENEIQWEYNLPLDYKFKLLNILPQWKCQASSALN